jgi:hypothetical protein
MNVFLYGRRGFSHFSFSISTGLISCSGRRNSKLFNNRKTRIIVRNILSDTCFPFSIFATVKRLTPAFSARDHKPEQNMALFPQRSQGDHIYSVGPADKTNGVETYGNGRYMYVSLPDSSNKVILDFNKAYNPPCAFSPFATCPMPPRENILDLRIEAGEKEVHLQ